MGEGGEEQGLASAGMAHLNSQLCHELLACISDLPLLQHAAGATFLQHQGPHRATSNALHTQDMGLASQPSLTDQW